MSSSEEDCIYDVVVIGGGPAGATAALYTARGELKTRVSDKGLRTGALGLASKIANYPGLGFSSILRGGRPIIDFLEGQLPTSESGCVDVDGSMHTTVPGVFAVGGVLCTHLKQAVVAAAEGAIAAMAVQRYLSGRDRLTPDWS